MKISTRIDGLERQLARRVATRIAEAAARRAGDGARSWRKQQGVENDAVRRQGAAGFDLRDAQD